MQKITVSTAVRSVTSQGVQSNSAGGGSSKA